MLMPWFRGSSGAERFILWPATVWDVLLSFSQSSQTRLLDLSYLCVNGAPCSSSSRDIPVWLAGGLDYLEDRAYSLFFHAPPIFLLFWRIDIHLIYWVFQSGLVLNFLKCDFLVTFIARVCLFWFLFAFLMILYCFVNEILWPITFPNCLLLGQYNVLAMCTNSARLCHLLAVWPHRVT